MVGFLVGGEKKVGNRESFVFLNELVEVGLLVGGGGGGEKEVLDSFSLFDGGFFFVCCLFC